MVNYPFRTPTGIFKLSNKPLKTSGNHISRNLNPNLCALSVSVAYMSLAVPGGELCRSREPCDVTASCDCRSGDTQCAPGEQLCWVRLVGSRSHGLTQGVRSTHRLGTAKHLFGFLGNFVNFDQTYRFSFKQVLK